MENLFGETCYHRGLRGCGFLAMIRKRNQLETIHVGVAISESGPCTKMAHVNQTCTYIFSSSTPLKGRSARYSGLLCPNSTSNVLQKRKQHVSGENRKRRKKSVEDMKVWTASVLLVGSVVA